MQSYNRKLKKTNRLRISDNKVRNNNKAYQRKHRKVVRQKAKLEILKEIELYYEFAAAYYERTGNDNVCVVKR